MHQDKTFLAIIPARSGSKGLPDKNIKELCGKPLIAWSIEAGLNCKCIDEVVVSTDSEKYAEIAVKYGASVPFIRPPELATDTATTFDTIKHCIDFYKNELGREFDYIVLLEPTSPLRGMEDIEIAARKLFETQEAKSIVGICKTESQNPAFLILKDEFGFIHGFLNKEIRILRRQEIENVYFFEGSLYISDVQTYLVKQSFYHEKTIGYDVPKWKSLEIDDMDDFVMVEAMMRYKEYCK